MRFLLAGAKDENEDKGEEMGDINRCSRLEEGLRMTKKTKKDGGTKQKGKHKPTHKTSGSANGQNGYH